MRSPTLQTMKMFTGSGVVYSKPAYRSGSGWLQKAWAKIKSIASPYVKSTGKALLASAKDLGPQVLGMASSRALEELSKQKGVPDGLVNALSTGSQKGLAALDASLKKGAKDDKPTAYEKGVADFVSGQSQKILANLMKGQGVARLGSGVARLGSGTKRLGQGLQIEEAARSGAY